jgi:Flp pilus assembly pilin Flp
VKAVRQFVTDQAGADFIEYAFIIGVICVATATIITPLMPAVLGVFDNLIAAVSKVKP